MSSEVSVKAEPGNTAQAPFTLQLQSTEPGPHQSKRQLWKAPSGVEGVADQLMPHNDEDGLHAYVFINGKTAKYPQGFKCFSNCTNITDTRLGHLATNLSDFFAAHAEDLERQAKTISNEARRSNLREWMRKTVKSASENSIWLIETSLSRKPGFKDDPWQMFERLSKLRRSRDEAAPPLSDSRDREGLAMSADQGGSSSFPRNSSLQEASMSQPVAGLQNHSSTSSHIRTLNPVPLFLRAFILDPFEQIPDASWTAARQTQSAMASQERTLPDRENLTRVVNSLRTRDYQKVGGRDWEGFRTIRMSSASGKAAFLTWKALPTGQLHLRPRLTPQQWAREQGLASAPTGAGGSFARGYGSQAATVVASLDPATYGSGQSQRPHGPTIASEAIDPNNEPSPWAPVRGRIVELPEDQLEDWLRERSAL